MKRITDPTFRYTHSSLTDLSKTFARERRRLKEAAELAKRVNAEQVAKVRNII